MARALLLYSSIVATVLGAVLPISSHSLIINEDLFENQFKFTVYLEFPNGSRHGDIGFPDTHRYHQGTGALYSDGSRYFIVTCAHLFTRAPYAVIRDPDSGRFVQNRTLFPHTLTLRVAAGDMLSYGSQMAIENFLLVDQLDDDDQQPQVRINIPDGFVPESDPLRLNQRPKDHWAYDIAVLELGGPFASLVKNANALPVSDLVDAEKISTGGELELYGFTAPRLDDGPIDFEVDSVLTGGSYKVGVEEVDCKGHFDEKRHLICLIGDGKSPGATTKFGNQGAIAIARDRKGGRIGVGVLAAAMNVDGEQFNYLSAFSAHKRWLRSVVGNSRVETEKSPKAIDFL